MAEELIKRETSKFDELQEWFEKNQKPFNIALITLLIIVTGSVYYFYMYIPEQQQQAEEEIYKAQEFFSLDSFSVALNGRIGSGLVGEEIIGFLEIAENYPSTITGNVANYYAGVCYLRLGQYQNALDAMAKYSPEDKLTGTTTYGTMGDAYMELDNKDEALSHYIKAAAYYENNFTSPFYLYKAGQVAEIMGNPTKALKLYEEIKTKYPKSQHGTNIANDIARVK